MTADLNLDNREKLVIHIDGLQVALAKRNETIARLEAEIALLRDGEPSQAALKKAYQRGWKACASSAIAGTTAAINALQDARRIAFDTYEKEEIE